MTTPPGSPTAATSPAVDDGAHRLRLSVGATVVALIDLLSKAVAVTALPAGGLTLPGPVDLRLAHNRGVAFSAGTALPAWLIITLTAAATLALATAAWRGALPGTLGPALMVGGAAANLLDRLRGGSVVDLFHTGWWPTFNLADVALTTGVAWTLLYASRPPRADAASNGPISAIGSAPPD